MTINNLDTALIAAEAQRELVMEWTDALYNIHFSSPEYMTIHQGSLYNPDILCECVGDDVTRENMEEVGIEERIDFLRNYIGALAKKGIPYIITPEPMGLVSLNSLNEGTSCRTDYERGYPENTDEIALEEIKMQIMRSTIADLYLEGIDNTNPDEFSGTIESIYNSATENESQIFAGWQKAKVS